MYDLNNNNEWGEAEREADEDIKTGHYKSFHSAKELIEELHTNESANP